jgi:hypothetical protein
LAWIVGHRAAFGPGGVVPVASSRKTRPIDRPGGLIPLLRPLLSADFHDMGKLSEGFASVLCAAVENSRKVAQPVRHELVSLLVLSAMVEASGATDDAGFLAAISTPERAATLALEGWNLVARYEARLRAAPPDTGLRLEDVLPDARLFPFLRGVAALCITHHRLPDGQIDRERMIVTDFRHT